MIHFANTIWALFTIAWMGFMLFIFVVSGFSHSWKRGFLFTLIAGFALLIVGVIGC